MALVEKRNGQLENFNKEKIVNAIYKAFIDIDKIIYETDTANDIADEIENYANKLSEGNIPISVEAIQNMVEDYLMRSERRDVARAYIRYRYKQEVARERKDDFIKAIREKLNADNVVNQNANVDEHSFGGRTGEASSVVTKQLALDYIVSPMARDNHLNNEVYIHDLDSYYVGSHNCLSIPFDDLLANGFNTRQTDVRPAGSVNTAFQLVAVIFQLQSLQQFGGVSATHLDWTMVPYVRKSFYKHYIDGLKYIEHLNDCEITTWEFPYSDRELVSIYDRESYKWNLAYKYAMDMTEKEVHQAVEGMYHNLKFWA